jgi:hypothetical protein
LLPGEPPRVRSHQTLGHELVVISLFQELLDVFRILGLFEESAEGVVSQLTRDVFQGTQVIAGAIGRRDK